MASHEPFGHLNYGRKKGQELNWQFDSRPLKLGINPIPMRVGGVQYVFGKLSRRAISLIETSPQSKVGAKSYDRPKSKESKPGQFRDSTLGVLGKSAIRMWVRRRGTENIIWGRVVASPESELW